MTVGDRIKDRRLELNMSQQELAHRLGDVSISTISVVEHNKVKLSVARLKRYADALSTTSAYLLGENEESEKFEPEDAHLVAAIRKDRKLLEAIKKYFTLPENEQQHIIDMINLLAR